MEGQQAQVFLSFPLPLPAKQKKRQTNLISRVSGVGVGRARMFVCFIVYMFNMFVSVFLYLISYIYKVFRQDFVVKGQDFGVFSVEC